MGQVMFYHLTERPLEATLPVLLEKSMAAGWRVIVRGRERGMLEHLDAALWKREGFLPHGLNGGEHDAAQPVLLTDTDDNANGAVCLMSVGGAGVDAVEAQTLERVCILFDGADAGAVEHARNQWRTLIAAGVEAAYWAEEDGRWVKKAESGG